MPRNLGSAKTSRGSFVAKVQRGRGSVNRRGSPSSLRHMIIYIYVQRSGLKYSGTGITKTRELLQKKTNMYHTPKILTKDMPVHAQYLLYSLYTSITASSQKVFKSTEAEDSHHFFGRQCFFSGRCCICVIVKVWKAPLCTLLSTKPFNIPPPKVFRLEPTTSGPL